jgi:hypothetical protein
MGKSRKFREHNLQFGLSPQIAIAGWRGIVSTDGLTGPGAAEEAGGSKASVSRWKECAKREECGDRELALHGKRLVI